MGFNLHPKTWIDADAVRRDYEANHTSVKELGEGESTTINSPFGFLWFGPTDGIVTWSSSTYRRWVEGETIEEVDGRIVTTPPRQPVQWPDSFDWNGWHFEKAGEAYQGYDETDIRCIYRRVPEKEANYI